MQTVCHQVKRRCGDSTAPFSYTFDRYVHQDKGHVMIESLPGGIVNPKWSLRDIDIETELRGQNSSTQSYCRTHNGFNNTLPALWRPDIPRQCDEPKTVALGVRPENGGNDEMFMRNQVVTKCGAIRMSL